MLYSILPFYRGKYSEGIKTEGVRGRWGEGGKKENEKAFMMTDERHPPHRKTAPLQGGELLNLFPH